MNSKGKPGSALDELIGEVRNAGARGVSCTYFLDVVDLYDARNALVHAGRLGLSARQGSQATWFIPAWLLRPVLRWFAGHPDAELTELDAQIAALSPAIGRQQ
jgi:hypothetical protein